MAVKVTQGTSLNVLATIDGNKIYKGASLTQIAHTSGNKIYSGTSLSSFALAGLRGDTWQYEFVTRY